MRKEFESIDWDKQKGSVIVTRQETITIDEADEDIKQKVRNKLKSQVKQIKALKEEAQKTRALLDKLEGKTGLTKSPVQRPGSV